MKKFLRLSLKHSERDIPAELDAVILSAAAMRAKSTRKKRLALKIAVPGITAAGAAAAALLVALPIAVPRPANDGFTAEVRDIAQIPSIQNAEKSNIVTTAELLALADTTLLEQESYNLATMADFSLDGDNFTM